MGIVVNYFELKKKLFFQRFTFNKIGKNSSYSLNYMYLVCEYLFSRASNFMLSNQIKMKLASIHSHLDKIMACSIQNFKPCLVLRLHGGAKKRKKKTYTKPKKKAHVHKKIKLRVLKYFKVQESGKITRLRSQCPQCGPGTFMAVHADRTYCGRCGFTNLSNIQVKDGTNKVSIS